MMVLFNTILEETYTIEQGCDSTHQIAVIFEDGIFTADTLTFAEGDTAIIFGNEVTANGVFSETFVGSNTCDSTHAITVTFVPDTDPCTSVATFEQLEICFGDSLLIFGNWITEEGIYSDTLMNSLGCDSSHQITINVFPLTLTSETLSYTEGDTAVIFGNDVVADGIFSETFSGMNSCDSTHTITVIFLPVPCSAVNTTEALETCQGDSLLIFGNWIIEDGILLDTFMSALGCDSIHQITATFLPTIYSSGLQQFCSGEVVLINGQSITSDQIIEFNSVGANGCDSIHQSFIEFTDEISTSEMLSFCAGDIAMINGQVYLKNQIVSDTFESAQGCDSIHLTTLLFQEAVLTNDTIVACVGDTVFIENEIILGLFAGTENIFRNGTGQNGCDSNHLINLSFVDPYYQLDTFYYCEGETAEVFGVEYFETQLVGSENISALGCDSINEIQLIFSPEIFTSDYIELCEGESMEVFGIEIFENEILSESFLSADGCDSIHQVEVFFTSSYEEYLNEILCPEEILVFYGDTISSAGTYFQALNPLGTDCDSMSILTVEVTPEIEANLIPILEVESGVPFVLPLSISDGNMDIQWTNSEYLSCDDCVNPSGRLDRSEIFTVLVSNEFGCSMELRVQVLVKEKAEIYIPNVFSPNNDGVNDAFTVYSADDELLIKKLQIFDRWGGLVFEANDFLPNDSTKGWDGRSSGIPLNTGVYVYQIDILLEDGTSLFRAGDVALIR